MRGTWQNLWDNVQSSLWFIPTVLVALALLLSSLLIEVDVVLAERQSTIIPWLFSGTADAARTILSVVAGSLITVISIAISLTMVALVQASAQFTPRLLRQFTASRTNQVVLGAYTATFIFALLVLRTVRSADQGNAFVPALSVTVAVALSLLCLGLLIYFIHHMSQSLQVAVILEQVRHEFIESIDALFPERLGQAAEEPLPASIVVQELKRTSDPYLVRSTQAGFIRRIDEQTVHDAPLGPTTWIWIRPRIGDFVTHGSVLAALDGDEDEQLADHLRSAFVIDRERTTQQDPLFAIRQLVDVALKALSPGINDMTTAEYALYHLGDALCRLADRPFPSNIRTTANRRTRLMFSRPMSDDFVEAAFSQIRHAAQDDVHVTATLLRVLHDLAQRLPPGPRGDAVQHQVAEVRLRIDQGSCSPTDKAMLYELANAVGHALRT